MGELLQEGKVRGQLIARYGAGKKANNGVEGWLAY